MTPAELIELNAAVASEVMGECAHLWTWGSDSELEDYPTKVCSKCGLNFNGIAKSANGIPDAKPYSTDGNAMLAVLSKLRELGWRVQLNINAHFCACMLDGDDERHERADAETLPMSVALAALQTVTRTTMIWLLLPILNTEALMDIPKYVYVPWSMSAISTTPTGIYIYG